MNTATPAGAYALKIGGNALRQLMKQPGENGMPTHRFTKLVLDRWALAEPSRFRMLCQNETQMEWLLEAATEQGDREMELLTSLEAQRQRENGMMDTDILKEASLNLRMDESLPYRRLDVLA